MFLYMTAPKKIHAKEFSVTGIANTRVLSDVLQSSNERTYHIIDVLATETTAAENNDATLEVWNENDQIVTQSIEHFLTTFDSATREFARSIPLNMRLIPGFTLKVGHTSGGTLSVITYNVRYFIEQEQR